MAQPANQPLDVIDDIDDIMFDVENGTFFTIYYPIGGDEILPGYCTRTKIAEGCKIRKWRGVSSAPRGRALERMKGETIVPNDPASWWMSDYNGGCIATKPGPALARGFCQAGLYCAWKKANEEEDVVAAAVMSRIWQNLEELQESLPANVPRLSQQTLEDSNCTPS